MSKMARHCEKDIANKSQSTRIAYSKINHFGGDVFAGGPTNKTLLLTVTDIRLESNYIYIIDDLPTIKMAIFHSYVNVYQKVPSESPAVHCMGKTTSAAVFTFAWHGQNLEITGRRKLWGFNRPLKSKQDLTVKLYHHIKNPNVYR